MPAEPRAILINERLLLQLLFTILQGHSLSTTAYQLSLLLRQDALAYFALVEAHLLQEQIDPVPEYVRDEFVCPVLYCKQGLQRHLGCYIIDHGLAYRGKVQCAFIDYLYEVGSEVLVPNVLVDFWQFEEVSCDDYVEAVVVSYLLHQGLMLFQGLSLQVLDYELKRLEITRKSDFYALVITHSLNDGPEVSYSLIRPLFVKQDLSVSLTPLYDDSYFLEVKWLLVHDLDRRVVSLVCFLFVRFVLVVRVTSAASLRFHAHGALLLDSGRPCRCLCQFCRLLYALI